MSILFTLDDFPDWLPFLPWRIVFVRHKSEMFNSYGKNNFLDIQKNVVFDTLIWGNKETELLYTEGKSQNPLETMSFSTRWNGSRNLLTLPVLLFNSFGSLKPMGSLLISIELLKISIACLLKDLAFNSINILEELFVWPPFSCCWNC